MRIAYLSADHGIPVTGDKGAAVHIQEVTAAMHSLGHVVELMAARVGDRPERLTVPVEKIRSPLALAAREAEDPRESKERRNLAVARAAVERLTERHSEAPYELIYERYSLWSDAAIRLKHRLGIPVIVEVNAPLLEEQRRYRKLCLEDEAARIAARVFSEADLLVAVSAEIANYLIARGASEDRILVVPNGIDPEKFNPTGPKLGSLENLQGPVIGFCGSFKPWHGLELLMPAFRQLASIEPSAHLLLVGTGPLEDWIRGYVEGAGLEDRVTLTGWLDGKALPSAIRAMDVAVAPYPPMPDFYFSPLKIYEYLACGVPVVARHIGQIAEIVEHGVNGLLISPGDDWQALAGALRRTCDTTFRKRLAAQIRTDPERWSWRGKVLQILETSGRTMPRSHCSM